MTDPLSIKVSYMSYWYIYRLYIKWYEEKHLKNVNQLIVLNDEIKSYYSCKYPFIKDIIVLEQGINTYEIDFSFQKKINTGNKRLELIYTGVL